MNSLVKDFRSLVRIIFSLNSVVFNNIENHYPVIFLVWVPTWIYSILKQKYVYFGNCNRIN